MKKSLLITLLILIFVMGILKLFGFKNRFVKENQISNQKKEQKDFNEQTLYQLSLSGVNDSSNLKLEYHFYTNKLEKANELKKGLDNLKFDTSKPIKSDSHWTISGWTQPMNMDIETVTNWCFKMIDLGFKNDCSFDGWGTYPNQDPEIELKPNLSIDEYNDIALELLRNNKLIESEAYFSKVIELEPNKEAAFYNRGIVKSSRGNKLGAIDDYDKAIELKPDYDEAYSNRGADKDEMGNYEEAIKDYNKAIELNPKNPLTFLNRGNTYYRMGEKEKSCNDWKIGKELGDKTCTERVENYCK